MLVISWSLLLPREKTILQKIITEYPQLCFKSYGKSLSGNLIFSTLFDEYLDELYFHLDPLALQYELFQLILYTFHQSESDDLFGNRFLSRNGKTFISL